MTFALIIISTLTAAAASTAAVKIRRACGFYS